MSKLNIGISELSQSDFTGILLRIQTSNKTSYRTRFHLYRFIEEQSSNLNTIEV